MDRYHTPMGGEGRSSVGATSRTRALVAWCPDWPVVCAGLPPGTPVAVVRASRVVATSPAARASGVKVGMRRREAQARCPDVEVLAWDLAAQARRWEPVVAAVEAFSPGVEVLQPGQLALSARGPSRYFGGDNSLANKVCSTVEEVAGTESMGWTGCCQVGVADGLFAAGVAAHSTKPGRPVVVPDGGDSGFLAPFPVRVLALESLSHICGGAIFEDLVDLLGRLGLKKLGDLAALPAAAVADRFGPGGLLAHRLAGGDEQRVAQGRAVPPEWAVVAELDPPAEQLQAAVFVGRALADELHQRLSAAGLVCTRLVIEAQTEHGTSLRRSWRHDGALSAVAIGERVRWQLEGWASNGQAMEAAQAGPVTILRLVPEQVRSDQGRQLGFWGGDAAATERAARAMARVQSLLGPEGVLTALLQGGRDHHEQVLLVPWGEPREGARPAGPWPGRLPGLAPSLAYSQPKEADVLDRGGQSVTVAARGGLSGEPAFVRLQGGAPVAVQAWAGPWPLSERWWDVGGRRRARFQVCTAEGLAYLLAREKGRWWLEAAY